jgi:hypothetical protein
MFAGLGKYWRQLSGGTPGRRFQEHYLAHERSPHGKAGRLLRLAAGVAIIMVGIIALPAPGPGLLVIAVGAGILARESAGVARGLDWLEVNLRRGWTRGKGAWSRASTLIKLVLGLVGAALLGAVGVMAYGLIASG